MLDPELRQRAILGGLRNMSNDIITRPRPRAQYIHYWRSVRKKIIETIPDLQDPGNLKGILGILDKYQSIKNQDSPSIARDILEYMK